MAVWLVLIGVEIVHGTLRTIFLAPLVGDFHARQISVFTGSVLIVLVAYLFAPWIRAENTRSLILVGFLWLVLTVAFELGFGYFVSGPSWESLGSEFDVFHGLLPFGLVVLTFSPLICGTVAGFQGGEEKPVVILGFHHSPLEPLRQSNGLPNPSPT